VPASRPEINNFNMNKTNILVFGIIPIGVVVLASLGLSYASADAPVEFLGLHFPATDLRFIPPIAGLVALIGGSAALFMRSKHV
jgi:hypothetical protein